MNGFILHKDKRATIEDIAEALEKEIDTKIVLIDKKVFDKDIKAIPKANKIFLIFSKEKGIKIPGAFTISSLKELHETLNYLKKEESDVSLVGNEITFFEFDKLCNNIKPLTIQGKPLLKKIKKFFKKKLQFFWSSSQYCF